jgi:hypothetical protein
MYLATQTWVKLFWTKYFLKAHVQLEHCGKLVVVLNHWMTFFVQTFVILLLPTGVLIRSNYQKSK